MTTKTIIHVLILLAVAYAVLNLYAFVVSDKLLFAPQPPSYNHLPHEFKLASGGGQRIHAVYLEHPDAQYTILFSHGNAEDLGNVVPFMEQFHDLGYSVLMYDYRGFGASEGKAGTLHTKEDVLAAYDWLVNVKKIPPDRIISQGRSLGGGVAVWLAAHRPVAGVITEISFASAFRVKTHWKLLPWDKFNSARLIRKVNAPVLVIHGTDDDRIPFWHGEKVYAAAKEPKSCLWIPGGQHYNYAYVAKENYMNSITEFFAMVSEYQSTKAE